MKAIRTHERTGISGLVFEEAPEPKPMFCEVLVKVAACGITHNELDWPIWTCRAGHGGPRSSPATRCQEPLPRWGSARPGSPSATRCTG